jgi:hypothetical protein
MGFPGIILDFWMIIAMLPAILVKQNFGETAQ